MKYRIVYESNNATHETQVELTWEQFKQVWKTLQWEGHRVREIETDDGKRVKFG